MSAGVSEGRWLAAALELDGHGFRVLPASAEKKIPALWLVGENKRWKRWQVEATTGRLRGWLERDDGEIDGLALCVLTGAPSKLGVLDIDSPGAYDMWRSIIGDDLDATCQVRTQSYDTKGGGGVGHYYWRLEGGIDPQGSSQSDQEAGAGLLWDWKARGGHVIVPPSAGYTWIDDRGPDQVLAAPEALLAAIAARRPGATPASRSLQEGGDGTTAPRTVFSKLLADIPNMTDNSGRNSRFTQMAGHLARIFPYEDSYTALLQALNLATSAPLEAAELRKTAESIWRTEQSKNEGVEIQAEPTVDTGWLAGDGRYLYTVDKHSNLKIWSDCDLRALCRFESEAGVGYNLQISYADGTERLVTVEPGLLGSNSVGPWMSSFNIVPKPPGEEWSVAHRLAPGRRLQTYLNSQNPPVKQAVDHLGWHDDEGFITFDGIIRPHQEFEPQPVMLTSIRASREASQLWCYGFEVDETEAIEILRQVAGFHEPWVMSVILAYDAAVVLKAQIFRELRFFPNLAIISSSGVGKSRGGIRMANACFGIASPTDGSSAGVKRRMGLHRSGALWVDDKTVPDPVLLELFRQVVNETPFVNAVSDSLANQTWELRTPIIYSSESFPQYNEKAQRDRFLCMRQIPNPSGRTGANGQPQLDDINALWGRWPQGPCAIAGTVVQSVLRRIPDIPRLIKQERRGSGRHAEKLSVARVGARIIADLCDLEWVYEEVDQWCDDQEDLGAEDSAVEAIVWLYHTYRNSNAPGQGPLYQDQEGEIWLHVESVGREWRQQLGKERRQERLVSDAELREQMRAFGVEGRGVPKWDSKRTKQTRYHQLPPLVRDRVRELAGYESGLVPLQPGLGV